MILNNQTFVMLTQAYNDAFGSGKYQKVDPAKLGTDLNGATTGGGSYDHGYGFVVTKHIKPFIIHADALWNFPQLARIDGIKVQHGDYAKYDLGAEYFFQGIVVRFIEGGLFDRQSLDGSGFAAGNA